MIICGLATGLLLGTHAGFSDINIQVHLPGFLDFPLPAAADFSFALLALVLPQLPITMGNAILAYTDLSQKYFEQKSVRVTNRNVCFSMAFANLLSFCLGGMPMCYGAGGLAAHYRFGARTAGHPLLFFLIKAVMI